MKQTTKTAAVKTVVYLTALGLEVFNAAIDAKTAPSAKILKAFAKACREADGEHITDTVFAGMYAFHVGPKLEAAGFEVKFLKPGAKANRINGWL